MLGRYYNDPKVIGFDGKKFTYDHLGILPQTINVSHQPQQTARAGVWARNGLGEGLELGKGGARGRAGGGAGGWWQQLCTPAPATDCAPRTLLAPLLADCGVSHVAAVWRAEEGPLTGARRSAAPPAAHELHLLRPAAPGLPASTAARGGDLRVLMAKLLL